MISDNDSEVLDEISEMLNMLNNVLEAIIRVMEDPDPDSDDVAFLEAFSKGVLDNDGEEWIDDTWSDAMRLFPMRIIIKFES